MPGIVLNPIAHFSQVEGAQPPPPYIPTYDSIYVSSYNLYQVSGSQLGSVSSGGIAKMDFSGSLDTTWISAVNVGGGTGRTLKEVRYSQGARGSILMDCRITSASADWHEIRLVDKTTGAISASSGLHSGTSAVVRGMETDDEETHIYVYGDNQMEISGSNYNSLTRFPYSTIQTDSSFDSNIGAGPTSTIGGEQGIVKDVYINQNGKIGVAHNGTTWNNVANKYANFVVLNNDGTVDTSFDFDSSKFKDRFGSEIQNGAIDTVAWFESGSSGIWVVGGGFEQFGSSPTSASYDRIMAFNEDGSINDAFTTNINSSFAVNNKVREIVSDASNQYHMLLGEFNSPSNKVGAIDSTGGGQAGFNNSNSNAYEGVVYNNQLYWLFDGASSTDNSSNTRTADTMGAIDVFSFNNTSYFDIGTGLQNSGGTQADPNGSIFLG